MKKLKGIKAKLLRWLEDGNTITAAEAFSVLGTVELPARVSDLRKMGYEIEDEWIEANGARFKRYWLAS